MKTKVLWYFLFLVVISATALAADKPYRADMSYSGPINDANMKTGEVVSFYAAIYYIFDHSNHWIVRQQHRVHNFKIPKQCYQYNPVNDQEFIAVHIYEGGFYCTHAADEGATLLGTYNKRLILEETMRG